MRHNLLIDRNDLFQTCGWVNERWGVCVRGPGEWVSGSSSEVRGYKRSEVLGVVQVGMVNLGVGRWHGHPIQVGN
jgi:hypothetical protein